jgi:leucyl/phenylalanyl-tRNA--protein transferase
MAIYWLSENNHLFPPVHLADQDGLLAIGGDLSPQRLLVAYSEGIFPWFGEDDPYLWWSPDPRFVLFPDELRVSKSMRTYFNGQKFQVTFDRAFLQVIERCRDAYRKGQHGTWITPEMLEAYHALHLMGYAHSVEVWEDESLVGGLYGIALGRIFFGESMFATVSNASKFGFITLVKTLKEHGFLLVDCQQETQHLGSLGARPVARTTFLDMLRGNRDYTTEVGNWGNWISH